MTRNAWTALAAATALAALTAAPAAAQIFGDAIGTDYDYTGFSTGFGETGYYDAIDSDDDGLLSEPEYATSLYADYDTDNDVLISEDEFGLGTDRYYGGVYDGEAFADYDLDGDGYLNQSEFGSFYTTEYDGVYSGYDTDADGFLSADEYTTGLYDTADVNQNAVIEIEEEGFFEGWFDGDDIEAEVETVGDVY